MKRLILLIGLGIGYVLGSKAGREQYRKIKDAASKTWQSPAVRSAAEKAEAFVADKAPALGGVAHTVLGGASGSPSNGSPSNGSPSNGASGSPSNGSPSSGASGSPSNGAPGAGSTDTGFSETGSATGGAPSPDVVPDVVADVDLGDDLRLDTDLGNEGERPA
jgi:hypothetical protein